MKRHWYEVLTVQQMLHWQPAGRSGAFYNVVFPDLPIIKHKMPKRVWLNRKTKRIMARISRRKNR